MTMKTCLLKTWCGLYRSTNSSGRMHLSILWCYLRHPIGISSCFLPFLSAGRGSCLFVVLHATTPPIHPSLFGPLRGFEGCRDVARSHPECATWITWLRAAKGGPINCAKKYSLSLAIIWVIQGILLCPIKCRRIDDYLITFRWV